MTISDDGREALVILAEEAAEVQKAIAKIFRFGLDSVYPDNAPTNKQKLINEIGDLRAAIWLTIDTMSLDEKAIDKAECAKLNCYGSGEYTRIYMPTYHWFNYAGKPGD